MANLLRAKREEDHWIVDVEELELLESIDADLASANGLLSYVIGITKPADAVDATSSTDLSVDSASAGPSTSRLPDFPDKRSADIAAGQRARSVAEQLRLLSPNKSPSNVAAGQRARQLHLVSPEKRSFDITADKLLASPAKRFLDFHGKRAGDLDGGPAPLLSAVDTDKRARHDVDGLGLVNCSPAKSSAGLGLGLDLGAHSQLCLDIGAGDLDGGIAPDKRVRHDVDRLGLVNRSPAKSSAGLGLDVGAHSKLCLDIGAGESARSIYNPDLSPRDSCHAKFAVSPKVHPDSPAAASERRYAPSPLRRLDRPKGRFINPQLAEKAKNAGVNLMKSTFIDVSNMSEFPQCHPFFAIKILFFLSLPLFIIFLPLIVIPLDFPSISNGCCSHVACTEQAAAQRGTC